MTDTSPSSNEQDDRQGIEAQQFISSNRRTVHKGAPDDGPLCGTGQKGEWASVDADTEPEAVLHYNLTPCIRCFDRHYELDRQRKKRHSSLVMDHVESKTYPFEEDADDDRLITDGGIEQAAVPLLLDDFQKCDECSEIVLIHGTGECLELDDATYCPRHAQRRMDQHEWDLRWGAAMRLLDAIREDPTKAVKYELMHGVGSFYAVHREQQHYELWRRCDDDRQRNFTTISESSLVEHIERRCAGSAYLYDPPHLVEIGDAPINAQPGVEPGEVTDS